MKLTEKISWLMSRVQKSLFSHINQCFKAPLIAQEEHLVSILGIDERSKDDDEPSLDGTQSS